MTVTPHELKEELLRCAFQRAGVERETWRPERGFVENRRTVAAVYDYYGRLFLDHPHLKWAGMANLIGPSFYAGFMDLRLIPDTKRKAMIRVVRQTVRRGIRRTKVAGFYETTFLTMQKKIFEDQAPMHEAYITHGLAKIKELYEARIIDAATLQAWQDIDDGRTRNDPALIDRGNRTLLLREQFDIIDRFYLRMLRRHRLEGRVITYLMTLAGAPSIPGAQSFPERFPFTLIARLARAILSLQTPLANGNIAVFANRWKLIEDDTLPRYLAFLRDRGDDARRIARGSVSDRAAGLRLLARAGRLLAGAITRWHLRVGPARAASAPTLPPENRWWTPRLTGRRRSI